MRTLLAAFALLFSISAHAEPLSMTVAPVDAAKTDAIKGKLKCLDATCPTAAPIEALRAAEPAVRVLVTPKGHQPLVIGAPTALAVQSANVVKRETGTPGLSLALTPEATKTFAALSAKHVNQKLAIIVGGRVLTAPVVREAITGGKLMIDLTPASDPAKLLEALKAR